MFAIAVSCNLLYQLLSQLYINCCYFFWVCGFKTLHDRIYIAKRCGVIGHMKIPQMAVHIMEPLCMSFFQWKKTDIFTLKLTMWTNGIGSNRIHWQYCFKELHSFCFTNILQWKCVIRLQKRLFFITFWLLKKHEDYSKSMRTKLCLMNCPICYHKSMEKPNHTTKQFVWMRNRQKQLSRWAIFWSGTSQKGPIKSIFISPTNTRQSIVLFQHGTISKNVYYVSHAQIYW